MVKLDKVVTKHNGKTEFRKDGTIKAFHLPVAKFRRVVTEKDIKNAPEGFKITVVINRYNQIHDIQPRVFGDKCLFDTYHGRQGQRELDNLISDAMYLFANAE
jgi:hypothetical protein